MVFDLDEVTTFSGFTRSLNHTIVSIQWAPSIPGISNAGVVPGSEIFFDLSWWSFEDANLVDLSWDFAAGASNWTYEISGLDPSPVPLPASMPLLLAALGAIGLLRRRGRRS